MVTTATSTSTRFRGEIIALGVLSPSGATTGCRKAPLRRGRQDHMMDSIVQIGPLALAVDRLIALAAVLGFLSIGFLLEARRGRRVSAASWAAVIVGIFFARAGYVLDNLEAYAWAPAEVLYVWQGGFLALPGIAAAAAVLLLMLRGRALVASIASLAVLSAASLGILAVIEPSELGPAPQMTNVVDVSGRPADLDTQRGPYVLNLWATWCPPCRREMPMLVETAAANPDVPILLLNQGERPETVRQYLRSENISGKDVLIDPRAELSQKLGATALPTTLFVASDGSISEIHYGEISRAALHAGIRQLRR